jgi:hypothetical protein
MNDMLRHSNKDHESRGIDWDLEACLEYNPQETFDIPDIKKVLAVYEGENDGADWHWVLELKQPVKVNLSDNIEVTHYIKGKYVYLNGWCDYTGWDCQSGASSQICHSAVEAAHVATIAEQDSEHRCHWSNWNESIDMSAYLLEQLNKGKHETWQERTRKAFGLGDG